MSLGIFIAIPLLFVVGVFVLANWRTFITFAITPAIFGAFYLLGYILK
jgi:hypothetical protein